MWGPLSSPLTTRVAVRVGRDRVRNQCASCLVLAAHGHVSDYLTLTHRHGRPRWNLTNQKCREYPRERSPTVRRMEIGRRPDHANATREVRPTGPACPEGGPYTARVVEAAAGQRGPGCANWLPLRAPLP